MMMNDTLQTNTSMDYVTEVVSPDIPDTEVIVIPKKRYEELLRAEQFKIKYLKIMGENE